MRPRVILITDAAFGDEVTLACVRAVARAVPAGSLCVQVRDKRRLPASLRLFATQMRRATGEAGAGLVINGHPELARDVGADGVHLGGGAASVEEVRARFGRPTWVSMATHSDADVRRAVAAGVDAVLVSPIFRTRTPGIHSIEKLPRGLDALRSARAIAGSSVAVVALGGVTHENARACAASGAEGVAVIRALLASRAPGADARAMVAAVTSAVVAFGSALK